MASLTTYINYPEVKQIYRARYANNGYFVNWANQLLEELEERGFLSTTIKEVGQIVTNKFWIAKPPDFLNLIKIYDPEDWEHAFRCEDVNGQFKLSDDEFRPIDDSVISASTNSGLTTTSITWEISNAAIDQFKNYLMYFNAGPKMGVGIILSGNDASHVTDPGVVTDLYFLFPQSLASGDLIGATIQLIPPGQYVMIRYESLINQISAVGDEIPIPDNCEARLVPTWLRWCIEKEALSTSKETIYWGGEVQRLIDKIETNRSLYPNQSKGRRLIGLERRGRYGKGQPSYKDCLNP